MIIFVLMNFSRKYRNRYVTRIELASALYDAAFLISPPNGFPAEAVPAEYHGVYFTLSSVNLTQKSKTTNAGTVYTLSLEFSFPNFIGADEFQLHFSRLTEIRLTLNTGGVIRINTNDISLNRPIIAEFQSSLKTVGFSAEVSQLFPFKINEQ